MQNVTTSANGPINRLFLAINHYVSTGDNIGEGTSLIHRKRKSNTGEPDVNDRVQILLAVNSTDPIDKADFNKFTSRFSQLQKRFSMTIGELGKEGKFLYYSFSIAYGQCDELAQALTEQPGALGWGSMKSIMEKSFH